jgi:Helix-hairpin-helix motif
MPATDAKQASGRFNDRTEVGTGRPAGRDEEAQLIVNPIAQPAPGRDSQTEPPADSNGGPVLRDPAVLARKRAFLTLEGHRKSLAARVPRMVRARTRYEGLCLVKMVTRLQRDYLSQSATGGDRTGSGGAGSEAPEHGVAEWARPWGPSCLLELQADLNAFDRKLKSARRWLSAATQRRAEARAGERFAAITARIGSDLKGAELTLPGWASSALRESRESPARGERRAGSRPDAPRRASSRRAEPRPVAPKRAEPRPVASRRADRAAPVADRPLDVNQATFEQLRSLDLSRTQSHRVLAYRKRLRGFESIEQLDDVPGFPKGTRDQLKHRLTV